MPPFQFTDVQAAALHFKVAPGTIHYWASIYEVPSIPDPAVPRRRLYSLRELDRAAKAQAAKRAASNRKAPSHGQSPA